MDRRYKNMRTWDGVPASRRSSEGAERLVSAYLARARRDSHFASDYGGSTGGRSSAETNSGLRALKSRGEQQNELRKIFDEEGRGQYGARAAAWQAKKDLYD